MNERTWNWVKIIGGILLGIGSLFALRHYDHAEGVMAVLPFVCLGIGCGAFGHGMGDLLSRKALASDPELARSLGAEVLTLGRRILRTETAPLAALSAIFYEKGDMEL